MSNWKLFGGAGAVFLVLYFFGGILQAFMFMPTILEWLDPLGIGKHFAYALAVPIFFWMNCALGKIFSLQKINRTVGLAMSRFMCMIIIMLHANLCFAESNRCYVRFPGYDDSFLWTGKCKNEYADGEGATEKYEGLYYIGHVRDGVPDGELVNGLHYYIGHVRDGVPDGRGELVMNGLHYKGRFENGYFVYGTIVYPDGGTYDGSFKSDGTFDVGEYIFPNGKKIYGNFVTKDGKTYVDNYAALGPWIGGLLAIGTAAITTAAVTGVVIIGAMRAAPARILYVVLVP